MTVYHLTAQRKIALVALVVASLGLPTLSQNAAAATKVKSGQASSSTEISDQLASLTKALAQADAKTLSSLWTNDGIYVDSWGHKYQGQAAIEQRFSKLFSLDGKQSVKLPADTIQLLSPGVGQVEGLVVRDNDRSPETRYAMVFVKLNNIWRIASATETPIIAQSKRSDLSELSWLIGDWQAEKDGVVLHLKADWTSNKSFIRCTYALKKPNSPDEIDIQIIGRDPRLDQLRSWSFDNNGGFGQSSWIKANTNQWNVTSTGTTHNGAAARSVNILSAISTDGFNWQSVKRTVNGTALADTAILKIERVKQSASLTPDLSR